MTESTTPSLPFPNGPRLLADFGATNARFCIEAARRKFEHIQVLPCADHDSIGAAIRAYLLRTGVTSIHSIAVAIANPIVGDRIKMTNHDWEFSIEAVRRDLGVQRFVVVNDFAALARAIPDLGSNDTIKVGGKEVIPRAPIGLLGPGTGLGVASLIHCGSSHIAIAGEGGHTTFSPANEREIAVLQFAWREYEHGHVSSERLMAGPGIELIYRALADSQGTTVSPLSTAQIVKRAEGGSDSLCKETVNCFCEMLGTFAGNLAVTLGAHGGIYIGGGVVPRLGELFLRSEFRARFEAKGRMRAFVASIPVYVITAPYPAFYGVSAMLDEALR